MSQALQPSAAGPPASWCSVRWKLAGQPPGLPVASLGDTSQSCDSPQLLVPVTNAKGTPMTPVDEDRRGEILHQSELSASHVPPIGLHSRNGFVLVAPTLCTARSSNRRRLRQNAEAERGGIPWRQIPNRSKAWENGWRSVDIAGRPTEYRLPRVRIRYPLVHRIGASSTIGTLSARSYLARRLRFHALLSEEVSGVDTSSVHDAGDAARQNQSIKLLDSSAKRLIRKSSSVRTRGAM